MADNVEQIYINVVARVNDAKKALEDIKNLGEKVQKPLKDELELLKERIDLREKYLAKTKEEQKVARSLLKLEGIQLFNDEEALNAQKRILDLKDKIVKKETSHQKKYKTINEMLQTQNAELEKQIKHIEILNERRKAGLQDYIEFTKRSSSENARFADRLDRRDRTRSLRENLRRGMEKGTAISQRWHAEENAVYRLERSLGIASTAFDRVRHPAEAMTDAFYRFQRIGYTVQTILGVLAGTIGDIVGGMMALVGVATAAAGSLVAVAGAFANLAAGMVTAKFALSGVGAAVQKLWQGQNEYNRALADAKKRFRDLRFEAEEAALSEQEAAIALEKARENLARVQDLPADNRARREAELEFQRAELNYRRAKARVKDTKDELKRGPRSTAGQNPFNNLTKSQIAFAKYLASLKPVVQALKEAAASSFLPPLQKSIQVMVDNLVPALKDGLNSVGEALGDASRNFTDAFKDKGNIKLFREFLENSKPTIRVLGAIANKAFGGILVVLKAAQPITNRFINWVYSVADGFERWAKSGGEEKLRKFFKLAGDVASNLGEAFKLVFGGLKNIVAATFPNGANSGAGGVILQWLKELGAGFKLFTGSNEFAGWLKGATENAKVALGAIGEFLKIFLDMAASPDNKIFWNTIREAVPFVRKILKDGQKVGPVFAEFLVEITKLISRVSESTAMQVFFKTLSLSAQIIGNFLMAIKPILDVLGVLHGAFLALVLVGILFRKTTQIIMGVMMKLLRVVGFVSTSFQNFRGRLAVVKAEGGGYIETFRRLRLEMTNLKRIEFLTDIAKGNRAKQIAEIRNKMAQLNMATDQGRKKAKEYQNQIDGINASYKKLKAELAANGKAAKDWGTLVSKSAESAKFSLDKFAATQDRISKFGRIGGRVGIGALGVGTAISSMQSGGGGIGAGITAIGAGLSFLPGVGMLAGIGTSIVGSIVSGFEQANAEKKAQEEQKKLEIKAKLAEINTEKLNQTTTAAGAFIGMGFDPEKAANITNNLITATEKLIAGKGPLLREAEGFTAQAAVSSLAQSQVLQGFLADPKTRGAILNAATTAAGSGLVGSRIEDGVRKIDASAITAFLETVVGDKTGQAAIDAVNAYIIKSKDKAFTIDASGRATISTYDQLQSSIDTQEAIAAAKLTAPGAIATLQAGLSALKKGQLILNQRAFATAAGINTSEVSGLNLTEMQALVDKRVAYFNKAMQTGQGFIVPGISQIPASPTGGMTDRLYQNALSGTRATGIPDANEIAFRRAMANMGKKPGEKDLLPKPTTTFYTSSLNKSQSMINILQEIRDNTKKPTPSGTTYNPYLSGVIPKP